MQKKESELRQRAEADGASEVKRAARAALDLANGNLASGHTTVVAATEARTYPDLLVSRNFAGSHVADGLAYLVYAARKDPRNITLGPRLASALATHNFLLPVGPGFACGSPVLAVHFTKDGRSIYVGTEDGAFRVFDAASGGLQHELRLGRPVMLGGWEFPRNNDAVFTVRFADKTFAVYDVKSGRPHWPPRAFDPRTWQDGRSFDRGRGAGISPDGRWLYALARDRFWIRDAATGAIVLQPVFENGNPIGGCDFTMDGAQFALTVGTAVKRWDLPGGTPVGTPIDAGGPGQFAGRFNIAPTDPLATVRTVIFSPNGRLVAVSGRAVPIMVFDAITGARIAELKMPGGSKEHTSVVFASDARVFAPGRRVSGSWDVKTAAFTPLPVARGEDLVNSSFDATGSRILTTATDGSVRICDLVSGELVAEPAGRQDRGCAALSPDGMHIVTGSAAGTVQQFRIGSGGARPLVIPRPLLSPTTVEFFPESPSRLLSLESTRARVLDLASGREIAGGFSYPTPVIPQTWAMVHSPIRADMKFVVVPTVQGLQAWELGAGGVTHVVKLEGSPTKPGRAWFSPRGDLVASFLVRQQLGVWNLRTGRLAGPIFISPNSVSATAFSPDGKRIALGTEDGACMIIDVATALPTVRIATRAMMRILAVAFSPDGLRLVTVNDGSETRIWNASTGDLIGSAGDASDTKILGLSRFSPDGRWFATWGLHSIRLWHGETGGPVGQAIPVWESAVQFTEDSRSMGTVDGHGSVQVWDVPSGQPFTEPMRRGFGALQFPEFSPDGRFVRVQRPRYYCIWSVPPRLPEGTPVPEWLLRLATVLAAKTVNEAGELVDMPDAMAQFHEVRREVAALAADAPLAEWGRWILDDRPNRPIAPGFTITPAEADKLVAAEVAKPATEP